MGFSKFSAGVVLLGILYSTAYCDTSNILSILKPSSSSSSHHHKNVHEYSSKLNTEGVSVQKGHGISKVIQKHPLVLVNATGNSTATGRQYMITGSTGWGWPGSTGGHLDLYSLLGGLAFLGLIASVFIYFFSNRTSTPTIIVTGKRRKRSAMELDDELLGDTFSDIIGRLGFSLDSPWWNSEPAVDMKNPTPFKLQ